MFDQSGDVVCHQLVFQRPVDVSRVPVGLAAMQSGQESAEAMKQTPMYGLLPRRSKARGLACADDQGSARCSVGTTTGPSKAAAIGGDSDSVRTMPSFFELLGGGKKDGGWDGSGMSSARLSILPGVTHYTIFSTPALAMAVKPFLDASMPEKSP